MFIDLRERERERERHQLVATCKHPNWESNPPLDSFPDWELNLQPFGVWDDAPTNSATGQGLDLS